MHKKTSRPLPAVVERYNYEELEFEGDARTGRGRAQKSRNEEEGAVVYRNSNRGMCPSPLCPYGNRIGQRMDSLEFVACGADTRYWIGLLEDT